MIQPIGYDYAGRPVYNMAPQQMQQPYPQPQPLQQIQAQQPMQQIRNGGIVFVASEEEGRRYPVAPGCTVTMRDENAPYLYEKTMGFSQLDQPIFRKARIIFEDTQTPHSDATEQPQQAPTFAEISQLEALRDAFACDIRELQKQLEKESSEIRSLVAAMIKPEPEKKTARKKESDDE